jgi:type I restriction enzyme S subunit
MATVPEIVERTLSEGTFSVEKFVDALPVLLEAVGGTEQLRRLVLGLAVRGRLLSPSISAVADDLPFALPEGWSWPRLGALGRTSTGTTPSTKDDSFWGGDVAFVTPGDIAEPLIHPAAKSLTAAGAMESRTVPANSVLMVCIGGSLGKVGVTRVSVCCNQQINAITPDGDVLVDYLAIALRSPYFRNEAWSRAGQGTLPIISKSKWEEIPIPLPPLAEQKRIVARVDQLMALIDQLEAKQNRKRDLGARFTKASLEALSTAESPQSLTTAWTRLHSNWPTLFSHPDNVDDLRRAVFELAAQGRLVRQDEDDGNSRDLLDQIARRKMERITNGEMRKSKPLPCLSEDECAFRLPSNWIWVRLGDAFDVRDGTHDTPKYVQEGVPLVTSKNLYGGVLDLSNTDLISEEAYREIAERSEVSRYDILFAMIGSIGNPVIVDVDAKFGIKNVALFKYDDLSLACPAFLLQMLRWAAPRMRALSAGAVQSFVSLGFLRCFPIPFPPLAEQKRIVARVEHLMKLCDALEAALRRREDRAAKLAEAVVQEMVA